LEENSLMIAGTAALKTATIIITTMPAHASDATCRQNGAFHSFIIGALLQVNAGLPACLGPVADEQSTTK